MPLQIIRDNIVHIKADAIVNAANAELKNYAPIRGGGVCGSIFRVAGNKKMQKACNKFGGCEVGGAVITSGFDLPAKYVIHAVGPVWRGGGYEEEKLLRSCYKRSLRLAVEYKLSSVAFPLISSGIYGYPKDKALQVAVSEISEFLMLNDMTVYIVVYDMDSFRLSEKLFASIQSFIDDIYVERREAFPHFAADNCAYPERIHKNETVYADPSFPSAMPQAKRLEDLINQIGETFSERLIRLIDEKHRTDAEVYKRANIDRRLFSKIRSNSEYKPSKNTALAFAIALELSLDDTRDLLMTAGFALSHSNKLDVIVEYFIAQGNYNIFEINEALFAFDQSLLGV